MPVPRVRLGGVHVPVRIRVVPEHQSAGEVLPAVGIRGVETRRALDAHRRIPRLEVCREPRGGALHEGHVAVGDLVPVDVVAIEDVVVLGARAVALDVVRKPVRD